MLLIALVALIASIVIVPPPALAATPCATWRRRFPRERST